MEFATIKLGQIYKLVEEVEVGEMFIEAEAIEQIEDILNLNDMDIDELRAMRNTIVKVFSKLIDSADDKGDVKEAIASQNKMSGIVAVIDNKIWKLGGEV